MSEWWARDHELPPGVRRARPSLPSSKPLSAQSRGTGAGHRFNQQPHNGWNEDKGTLAIKAEAVKCIKIKDRCKSRHEMKTIRFGAAHHVGAAF